MCTKSFWIELITLLYYTCWAMTEPGLRGHIYETVCRAANLSNCKSLMDNSVPGLEDAVQKYAANSLVYMKIIRTLPALLIITLCGAWTDSIGRKLPLIFPFIGMTLSLILYIVSYSTPDVFSTTLVGNLLSGLFGETGLILMSGFSYITDVTEKTERTKRLGRLAAMSFFGQFLGSLIIAIMIKFTAVRNVFIFALVINGIALVLTVIFLQDSLSNKTKDTVLCRLFYLVETWHVITKPRESKYKRLYIIIILVCIALHQAAFLGEFDITTLYVRHSPLRWSSFQFAYYLTGSHLCSGLGTLFLLPLLSGYFSVNDFSLAMVAIGFKVIQVSWQAFSRENWMVYFCLPMFTISSMFVPTMKSMLSKLIDDDEIGKIFALSAFGETLLGIVGSLMFTAVYGATVYMFQGLAFILQALFNICIFGIVLWLSSSYFKHSDEIFPKGEETLGGSESVPLSKGLYSGAQSTEFQNLEYVNNSNYEYNEKQFKTPSVCSDSEDSEHPDLP